MKHEQVTFRLDGDERELLVKEAESRNLPLNRVAKDIVVRYLAGHDGIVLGLLEKILVEVLTLRAGLEESSG